MIAGFSVDYDAHRLRPPIASDNNGIAVRVCDTTDTFARIIAARMQVLVGQPVIIENVRGAAGSISLGRAAPRRIYNYCGALADAKLPFDLLIFEPVVLPANNPSVIVSKRSLRPTSIASIATSPCHRATCAAATS